MVAYSPQHILRQFAFDQNAAYATEATCINVRTPSPVMLVRVERIYWGHPPPYISPKLMREGVRSLGSALHWARCIKAFTDFIGPDSTVP